MPRWMRNKVVPGYALGLNMNEFKAYQQPLNDSKTQGGFGFPLKLLPVNRTDVSQLWKVMIFNATDNKTIYEYAEWKSGYKNRAGKLRIISHMYDSG